MQYIRSFTSNRLEDLADMSAKLLSTPPASPMDKETIVVQSRGMERWVSMQLARNFGVWANGRFLFPNDLMHEIFSKFLLDQPDTSPFEKKIMMWKIMEILPYLLKSPAFEGIRPYFEGSKDDLKRLQLSDKIADTFEQYLIYRPEMILKWEQGREDHWQALLWRELIEVNGKDHYAKLMQMFLNAIQDPYFHIDGLPDRISVFGISTLPRFHIQLLNGISRFTEINLFLMNPSKEYWGDILSESGIVREISRVDQKGGTDKELHFEKGNSLLSSMGMLGRDFFHLISELNCEEYSLYSDPGKTSILTCIQSDILNLLERRATNGGNKNIGLDDTSIQIHSCHSPMREMDILNEWLLSMFERDQALMPEDILVMAPDIELYVPYIQSVFGTQADPKRKISFNIADRNTRRESLIIETFLTMLDLGNSRFGAPQVISILEIPAVHRAFGLSETDLDLIRRWVTETRIRWGIDGYSRSKEGLPQLKENTWKAGIERLLLGYAMPGEDKNILRGVLPFDNVEGQDAPVLGKFLEFTEQLFSRTMSFNRPRRLNEWHEELIGLLEVFFLSDNNTEGEMQILRHVLADLKRQQEISGFNEEIRIDTIKWYLTHSLERPGFGFNYLTGGVTFCSMLPMRSIPFKVICLIGMDNDAYPRQQKIVGFDLIGQHPKTGDRSRRNDDRYLFLEALLSARETLYISYIGQSIQDNSIKPPSVLVNELMDYIEQGFQIKGQNIREHIVTKHRLQAFSPEYFKGDGKLFSYSEENYQAACSLLKHSDKGAPLISSELGELGEEWKTIDLDDLCRFFANPTRFFLNKRLGIYIGEESSALEEREGFNVEGLERYIIADTLLEHSLRVGNARDLFSLFRASGQLPHGNTGECLFEDMNREVETFARKIEPFIEGKPLAPLEVNLTISGIRLKGLIKNIYPEMLIQYRYAKVKPRDRLKIWICHLILNAVKDKDYPKKSMLLGLPPKSTNRELAALKYDSVENSEVILEDLLEKYWSGLRKPLHFFPETSWAYAYNLLSKMNPSEHALQKAYTQWLSTGYSRGESEDKYLKICFKNSDPIDWEFEKIAREIFQPLLMCEKEM